MASRSIDSPSLRPLRRCGGVLAIVAPLLFITPLAVANDERAQPQPFAPLHPSEAGIDVTLTAGMWIPRLGGDVSLAPGTTHHIREELALGRSEPTINAELAIRKHQRWELNFGGMHFSTDGSANATVPITFGDIALAPGDPFRSEFSMTSVSAELRFTAACRPLVRPWEDGNNNSNDSGRSIADLRFMPLIGARWVSTDHRMVDLTPGGVTERVRGEWVIPYAGVMFELTFRPEIPLTESLRIHAGGTMGPALGGDGGFAWHIRAGLTWYATENLGVTIGYRLLELDVKRPDYELRGGLQGLFVGGTVRF